MTTKYIYAGGEDRPARVSFRMLAKLFAKLKMSKLMDLALVNERLTIDKAPMVCHAAFEAGAKEEGKNFDFTYEEVEDWLEEDFTVWVQIMEMVGHEFAGKKKEPAAAAKK